MTPPLVYVQKRQLKKDHSPFTVGCADLCEGGVWGPWEGRWVLLQLEGRGGLSSKRWCLLVSDLIPALSLFSPVVLSPKAVSSNWGLQLTRKTGLGDCHQSF